MVEKKHAQIVDRACNVLFTNGFHKTSMRDIALACNMSIGQLYHYISSKDDILYLVHEHMQKIWYEHLIHSGLEEIEDPLARLIKTIRLTLALVFENKALFLFIYTESKYLDKHHLGLILEHEDKSVVGFFRQLLAAVSQLKLTEKENDLAANLITFNVVFLALKSWNLRKTSLEENIDYITSFIIQGLGLDYSKLGK
ncbi:MAG: TetR/AcrR family transcriptional regulator [Proteobacteria bacterium]|nr:TetR/AcrR family transcriptional regulator [Pseudomonadota bacterium]